LIEIITSTACSSCQQLEAVLAKNDIPFREINIKTLGSEEIGELTNAAVELVLEGKADSVISAMVTPMVRYYNRGQAVVLFPVDLFDHGQVRIEALAAIKQILES
jgi:hypothetical protein